MWWHTNLEELGGMCSFISQRYHARWQWWMSPRVSLVQLHASLSRQETSMSLGDRRSWNPNIPRRLLDWMHCTNLNKFGFVYKHTSSKLNLNWFPSRFGLLHVFVCVAWIRANPVAISDSYPFGIATERIPHSDFQSKYYSNLKTNGLDARCFIGTIGLLAEGMRTTDRTH